MALNKMDEIKALFSEKIGVKNVDESKTLVALGLDSLDTMELTGELEDRYNIVFELEELGSIKTVADLYSLIEKKLK